MRVTGGCSAIFDRQKHPAFWVLAFLALAAIAAWRMGTASSVAAQANTKVNTKDGLTYVMIPPGTFQMGCSPDDFECTPDETRHSVTISNGFWIGQTEVTQAAYMKVVGTNPSRFKGDQLPVEMVSWDTAKAYCERVDMRLPTEAEWEYAARGGSPASRYKPLDQIAWYSENSKDTTHAVAQKQANGYGLYDMLGNVWEWVADWYEPYTAAAATDPKGPPMSPGRVLRGGSWFNVPSYIRVSDRLYDRPGFKLEAVNRVGFRCVGE